MIAHNFIGWRVGRWHAARKGWLLLVVVFLILLMMLMSTPVHAATVTTAGSGNWNSTTNNKPWPGGVVPATTDAVVIASGHTVTVTANAQCGSLTFSAGNSNSAVNINSGITLTVTNAVTVNAGADGGSKYNLLSVGAGTLSAGSISIAGGTGGTGQVTVSTGTINCTGNISFSGTAANARLAFSGAGTLNLGGNLGTGGTFTASTSTVNYNAAGAQTVGAYTYNNLTLSGSGTKTDTGITVNGILSIEGTATGSATPTYGANATLQYKGTGAQTTGASFPATWSGSGGVIIANTSGNDVTLGAAEVINAPLTINSSARLNTGNYSLALGGNFTNSGTFTAGSSAITISGTGTQSIAGFTTTGGLTVTKTGGTATLTSTMSPGALTMNGAGGTLNLGSGLTHTVTSVTLTAGTLDGGSSTLSLTGNWSGTGATFTASTSTVTFNGSSGQSITGARTFNNLTLNNSNGLTISNDETINGTLALASGKITTGANNVIMGTSGTVSGAGSSNYVYGNLQKNVATGATSRTFEIGTASYYYPVSLTFGSVSVAGNLTAKVTSGEHTNIGTSAISSSKDVNAYWTLTNVDTLAFTDYNATFTFSGGDIDSGVSTSGFIVGRYSGGWTYPTLGTRTSTSTQVTGVTSLSDFAIGDPTWESFRESGHTNVWGAVLNPYSQTYHTVFMYGATFTSGHTYAVGFYDNDGTKVGSDVSGTLSGTDLSCELELSIRWTSTAGLWHSVVFDTASGTPPATYAQCSGAPGYVVEDSFEAGADAIPEFPAFFSVIGVSGLCLVIYYLMRRRIGIIK